MGTYAEDVKECKDMMHKAAPLLKEMFKQIPGFYTDKVMIYPVEDVPVKICEHLDKNCGIDYYIVSEDRTKTVALAWRTERFYKSRHRNPTVYNAFSLREKRGNDFSNEENCEIAKRRKAMELGLVRPDYTAQLIYDPEDGNELLCLAIAKGDDVIKAHDQGLYRICDKNNINKDVYMHDVYWDKMKEHGYAVYDWYAKDKYRGIYVP